MSKRKRKENDIVVTFLGESRNDVTGSSVLVNFCNNNGERRNILIEMGLEQSNDIEKDISINRKMLQQYNKNLIKSIDYIFLLHPHADHVANLPYLGRNFEGRVLLPMQSYYATKDIINNSVDINIKNTENLRSKGSKIRCLYTKQNVLYIFDKFETVETYKKIKLNDNIEFEFVNSGHVLGGCMLKLWITKPNNQKKLLIYTSDMGSMYNNKFQYFVNSREQITKCNLLISEATYCDKDRCWTKQEAIDERRLLKEDIKQHLKQGKSILFSAFSFGRTQNLMCMLYDMFKDDKEFDYQIIIEGRLSHKINISYTKSLFGEELEYWKMVNNWKNFKKNCKPEHTKITLKDKTPKIIISASGFMNSGCIVDYLKEMICNENSVIYITGYCGNDDSIGGQLLNKEINNVNINGQKYKKKCIVNQLKTFSSHIQYNELISLFKGVECDEIVVHHCDKNLKSKFINEVREEFRKINKNTKIRAINSNDNIVIL